MPLIYVPRMRKSRYSGRGAYRRSGTRRRRTARGKGAYTVDDGPWAGRGATIGNAVARAFGAPASIGEWLGRRAFHYPAKWFGSGSYRRRRARGRGAYEIDNTPAGHMAPEIPRFSKGGDDDSIVISHREYIGDIFTSSTANAFSVNEFKLNPGDPVAFPWLSTVVQSSYQQFKFEGCIFQFQSTSSDALNSTNTALGAVVACVNYDANDPPFTSRMQMENTSWANCCKPSQNMAIPVECAPRMTALGGGLLYVSQNGVLPADADPKTYYLGKVSIATTGFQGTSINIGSLYVTYKVRLYKPIMLPPLSNANRMLRCRSGATSAAPLGTATLTLGADCDTLGVVFTSGTVLTIPKVRLQNGQRFLVILQWGHDSGAATPATLTWSTNVSTNFGVWGPAASTQSMFFPNPVAATQLQCCVVSFIEITNDNADAVCTLSAATLPANCTLNCSIWQICGMPSSRLGIFTA